MDRYNILTHQGRLQIVFKLKLELLRDIIFGKYKASAKDLINLVSDLIEIRQKLQSMRYARQWVVFVPLKSVNFIIALKFLSAFKNG